MDTAKIKRWINAIRDNDGESMSYGGLSTLKLIEDEIAKNDQQAPAQPLPSPLDWGLFTKWEKFTEWVGSNYIRLAGWWVANYSDQRDSSNYRSTQQLWEFYNQQHPEK